MSNYTYSPVSKSEIRLVSVKPSGSDGKLEASIQHVELDPEDPIKYTALSYTWGDPTSRVQIPCDGKVLNITTSLHEALLEIIKFSPHDEAETVLAWLGPALESTKLAVDFVKKVGEIALPTATDMFRWDNYDDSHEETKLERIENLTHEQSHELGIPFDDSTSWDAFSEFFDRPWFQRMWTVQEIIQARKAIVVCGAYSLPWEHVSAAARWFCYKAKAIHDDNDREVDGMCLVTQMVAIPWRAKMGSEYLQELMGQKTRPTCKWGLRDLLEALRPRLATDPRDKVFALLGISDEDMPVDYSISVKDAYTQATDTIIKLGFEDLGVIWSARQRNSEPGWPSWVPDWRLKTGTGCQWGIGAPLKTSGQPNGRHSYIATTEPHALAIRGKTIGRVTYKSQYRHFGDLFQNSQLREVHNACMERLDTYPTGENVETAFGLTMIGGLPLPKGLQKRGTSLETYAEKYMWFYDVSQMPRNTPDEEAARDEELQKSYKIGLDLSWIQEVQAAYCERRFVVTDSGHMGLAHHEVLEGDLIVVVVGLQWPCVLRPKSDKHQDGFEFIGDAYCHGVMNGEAVQDILQNEGDDNGQVFLLK
ncbi:hypothetical protein FSARC_2463 [Fusarium sarcochroum]|uniref:Heterokaryon incompatibility domain-containing protein n=1 Tax=Fusarium sarcochroum TaxID=1208366 RepID=A0A8H4U6R2_9HYPO|nr:hypothetical protein FSARC_2463 [Fusarium sarcochroum]